MEESDSRWPQLLRGSILSAAISKHVQYIGLADQRAQGMITINALLVPIALTGIQNPLFQLGAGITIVTAVLTILCAVASLYPKQYGGEQNSHLHLLHFSRIGNLSEEDYFAHMQNALEDTSVLSRMAAGDLYHISKRILQPKFFWLKLSYLLFLVGNILALVFILISL